MKIAILLPYKENFSPEYPGAVSLFVYETTKISKFRKDITIFGNGSQTRSFSFIEDTLSGIIKIINYENSDVFNIGNDDEITINDLAKKIIKITKSKSKIINLDLPTDDPKQRKPDLSKAKTILNYNPIHKLEDGLEITVRWFKENYK